MTATQVRPGRPVDARPPGAGGVGAGPDGRPGARRTALAMLASGLGVVALKGLFTDWGWLLDAWITMLVVLGPAYLLRLRRPPGALDIWPGIVLMVPWLTARFVPDHAWGHLIPNTTTWHDVSHLINGLHKTTHDDVAPIHTTVAVRLVICALLGLLAALIDLVAVVGRRAALAGVPLLVIYTVAGAVPRKPVSWLWFLFAGTAFLILLSLDAGDDLQDWGRRLSAPGVSRGRLRLGFSAQRIGIAALVVAVLLPLLVPSQRRNLIADAFHNNSGSGAGGFGASGGGSISPFAALRGQLTKPSSEALLTVQISGQKHGTVPFYLVTNVLSKYNGNDWTVGGHGTTQALSDTDYGTEPAPGPDTSVATFTATMSVQGLSGNPAVFRSPSSITGLGDDATWSAQDQLLLGTSVHRGQTYSENAAQPDPTVAELKNAPTIPFSELNQFLQLPGDVPGSVRTLVTQITKGASSQYERALAISDYFANPANGFQYSLKTKQGDSGSELVDFLHNKTGFCQQYAAATAVMFRLAGVPARVVLGYEHELPGSGGTFTVTTADAHAWVEAYFGGIGWIPFDTTPIAGLAGGQSTDLAWAPHDYGNTGGVTAQKPTGANSSSAPAPPHGPQASITPAATGTSSGSSGGVAVWVWVLAAIVAVAVLVLVPALVRAGRRRRRYLAARRMGDADILWAELCDTALDLGYVWSPARSPRQVASWLEPDVGAAAPALRALAGAVEASRYGPGQPSDPSPAAPPGPDAGVLASELREVTGHLRAHRSGRSRVRATLWPASLGWGRRFAGLGRRRH
jgi:transglutaminase-like putative cysteine protease